MELRKALLIVAGAAVATVAGVVGFLVGEIVTVNWPKGGDR